MARIREELVLYDRFTNTFTKYLRYGEQAANVTNQAKKATDQYAQSQKAAAASTNTLADSIKSLIGGYVGLQGLRAVLNLSDTIASTTARLDMMNDGLQTTAELNNMIWESAQRSRMAYTDTAAFVAKLGNLAGNAFDSNADIINFAEQINKQIVLSGASATEASAALLQLTQGLSSGVLRGEELNSVLEQTPMIAQTIAKYMGVTTGEMRELASEGKVTAAVVKNAMLEAAEETNAKFEQMPMTWSQVWTSMKNIVLKDFQPVLELIGKMADYIGDNLDTIMPVVYGLAAAFGVLAVAMILYNAQQAISNGLAAVSAARSALKAGATLAEAAATTTATGAQVGLNAALLACPLTWIIIAVAAVVALIVVWINKTGGLEIAWLKFSDNFLFVWDTVKAGLATGFYFVADKVDQLILFFQKMGTVIPNFMGDMKVSVLNILQSMVNGAIDIINWFIGKLNLIPGVSIDTIDHMTFATRAAAENEAAKARRNAAYDAAVEASNAEAARRQEVLANMWSDRDANHAARQEEIKKKLADKAAGKDNPALGGNGSTPYDELLKNTAGTKKNTASIAKAVDMTQEDIKSLVDVAERRYVNNINLTSKTPVINISGQNTGHTAADRQNLANAIRDILIEESASGAVRSTARPTAG